ncbi:hypothetical protein CLAFUW4_12930 [Fulvia fulva]|uniref:Uncharacterized protein n=1 Tax=Passalora fulva TaxID=5499 RepID=A0A9Q8PJR5_PASFU|nr:uncharacterized protein CLAFUR5_12795 [Fulvia fulva]KAK4612210.1 hypothetical protein CLAFUR4_12934 [Fulvia fulva]KAK4613208.1 hypothetical protein CLAFUR0_12940 [Fulvia fulva]UJO23659.1 hypothetical protein CLAFUR5_12795 [Fulvia fulva]WPV21060.1 hypothetical protein CLAFUW4_12930 [Fulvia fulva]WPV36282.1 hypothetical protein CLAFUW7_12937 [Fulvia fulva]
MQAADGTIPSRQTAELLDLAPELRDIIFAFCLAPRQDLSAKLCRTSSVNATTCGGLTLQSAGSKGGCKPGWEYDRRSGRMMIELDADIETLSSLRLSCSQIQAEVDDYVRANITLRILADEMRIRALPRLDHRQHTQNLQLYFLLDAAHHDHETGICPQGSLLRRYSTWLKALLLGFDDESNVSLHLLFVCPDLDLWQSFTRQAAWVHDESWEEPVIPECHDVVTGTHEFTQQMAVRRVDISALAERDGDISEIRDGLSPRDRYASYDRSLGWKANKSFVCGPRLIDDGFVFPGDNARDQRLAHKLSMRSK